VGLAAATDAPSVAPANATSSAARTERIDDVERIADSPRLEATGGGVPKIIGAPPAAARLEVHLDADANVPRGAVEAVHPEERVV